MSLVSAAREGHDLRFGVSGMKVGIKVGSWQDRAMDLWKQVAALEWAFDKLTVSWQIHADAMLRARI
jgi:hypothetical protein